MVTITCRLLAHSLLFADSSSAHQHLSADVSLMNFFLRHPRKGAGRLLVTGAGSPMQDQLPDSDRKQ